VALLPRWLVLLSLPLLLLLLLLRIPPPPKAVVIQYCVCVREREREREREFCGEEELGLVMNDINPQEFPRLGRYARASDVFMVALTS